MKQSQKMLKTFIEIFQLRELKNAAAALERFTFADKARQAIACLREIGYEHGKLLVTDLRCKRT